MHIRTTDSAYRDPTAAQNQRLIRYGFSNDLA